MKALAGSDVSRGFESRPLCRWDVWDVPVARTRAVRATRLSPRGAATRGKMSRLAQDPDVALIEQSGHGASPGRTTNYSKFLTRPGWLVLVPASVSFIVWAAPWGDGIRRGFVAKEPVTILGLSSLLAWYGVIIVAATVGWLMGRSTTPNVQLNTADDDRVYRIITLIAAVGVIGMYLLITAQNPGLLTEAFQTQQFNKVKQAIPGTPGLTTLRYASILGGAIALHRLVIMRQRSRFHVLNIVLLVLNVAVASRLALIMTLVVFAGLWAVRRPKSMGKKVPKGRIVVLVLVALGLLVEANYIRNANYYETFYGLTNPVAMAGSEAVTYVGAPSQVALYAGRDTTVERTLDQRLSGVTRLITPSFFTAEASSSETNSSWYRGKVDVEDGLTTNSAFASIYGQLGYGWALMLIGFVALVAGWLMGHFSRYTSYMVAATFVVGYCFLELWRTYLFAEGIVWFLVIALVGACWQARPRGSTTPRRAGDIPGR